jgi:methyl-accepting chemotaxis protein
MNRPHLPAAQFLLFRPFSGPIARLSARWRGSSGSIRTQLRQIVWALLAIQALLAMALLGTTLGTSGGVRALILDRLYPIGELQRVNSSYATALLTAHKVQSGNLSAAGAIGAIEAARSDIRTSWQSFRDRPLDARHADKVGRVEGARQAGGAA